MAEGGAWELTNPSKSTHRRGGALDKVLFQTWGDAPDCFLGAEEDVRDMGEWGGGEGEECYPAITLPVRLLGDHHPVIARLPYRGGGRPKANPKPLRRLKLQELKEGDWGDSDWALAVRLEECRRKLDEYYDNNNPTRLLGRIYGSIMEVFRGDFVQRKTKNIYGAPYDRFCEIHSDHPDFEELVRAHEDGDTRKYNKLRSGILRDGWRGFLRDQRTSST